MAEPIIEVTPEGAENRDKLEELAKKAGNNVADARTAVIEITQEYANMDVAARKQLIQAARAKIRDTKPGVGAFDANVFVFQVVVRAEENKDGNPLDDFKFFSEFNENRDPNHFHPDGLYGPRTKSVAFGSDKDKLNNIADKLDKIVATGGNIPIPTREGLGERESEADKAARLAREQAEKDKAAKDAAEAKKREGNRASAEDIEKYTFKRAGVQYLEEVKAKNPTAKKSEWTVETMGKAQEAVREYLFNEDGTLKTNAEDGRKIDIKNPTVQDQLREAIRTKTKELGATDDMIEKLSFSSSKTKTRTIVGSFETAENAMINADNVLSEKSVEIKAHFSDPKNKEYLESKGINTENIVELANVREDQRGLYFKTNFVPGLQALAEKEAIEIRKEYDVKIADEQAKLLKYKVLDNIVEIGYPRLVEVQKVDAKGEKMFKDTFKIAYDANGVEQRTPIRTPIMDEVKRPDEKSLVPIKANMTVEDIKNDVAIRGALAEAGLITVDADKNITVNTLSYTVNVNGKDESRSVDALTALNDPKKYNTAIKAALDSKYAFTEDEIKKNEFGGAKLDKGIINKKIDKIEAVEIEAVKKEVVRLEGERDVKIENSPSNVKLRDAFDARDSDRIKEGKAATSALGKYEQANAFYKKAAAYETARQIDELTGDGVTGRERRDLRKMGDAIEKEQKARVKAAQDEVKRLEDDVKRFDADEKKAAEAAKKEGKEAASSDTGKKEALQGKVEAAKKELEILTAVPKSFDQRDRVEMININSGGQDLIHVDAVTKKELKTRQAKQKAAEAEALQETKDAEKAAKAEADKAAKAEADKVKAEKAKAEPAKTEAKAADAVTPAEAPKAKGPVSIELTEEINALLEKIKSDAKGAQGAASALGDGFSDQKNAKKDWKGAVDLLEDDLKALKKFAKQDKAEGSEFDIAVEQTLKDAGVVVNKDLKLDEKQTIQSIKDKASQQR